MFGIFRPVNLLLLFAVQFTLWFRLCIPNMSEAKCVDFALICFSVICAAAAGYVINDIIDIESDKINKPEKIYVGNKISKKNAFFLYYVLNAASVFSAFLLWDSIIIIVTFLSILLLFLYSKNFKQSYLIGNLSIAFLSIIPIVEIFLYFEPKGIDNEFIAYALFAFLTTLAREIVKDKEDGEGDLRMGIHTLANIVSEKKIKQYLLTINTLLLFTLVIFLLLLKHLYIIPILVYCFSMILPSVLLNFSIFSLKTKSDYSQLSKYLKIYMFFGLIRLWL
jgi:4-hydroxybenzoate polyprenyltransferase